MVDYNFPAWGNKEVLTGLGYFLIKYLYSIQAVSPFLESL